MSSDTILPEKSFYSCERKLRYNYPPETPVASTKIKMSSRYSETSPSYVLDGTAILGVTTALSFGYVSLPLVPIAQASLAVAAGHLTGQFYDFRQRLTRRSLFQAITARKLVKVKKTVPLQNALCYLFGSLALSLQVEVALAEQIGAKYGSSDRHAAKHLSGLQKDADKSFKFLRSLCEGISEPEAKFAPFPRNIGKSARRCLAGCVFLLEKWWRCCGILRGGGRSRSWMKSGGLVDLFDRKVGTKAEEVRCVREAIRALAHHEVFGSVAHWGDSALHMRGTLLFLGVLDLFTEEEGGVFSRGVFHVMGSSFSGVLGKMVRGEGVVPLVRCGRMERAKRCLRLIRGLLQELADRGGGVIAALVEKQGR